MVTPRYGGNSAVGRRQTSDEVSKVGDWKTIDQREMLARRARKTKRHGYAAAGAGIGVAGAAAARGGEQRTMGELRYLGEHAKYTARTVRSGASKAPGMKSRLLRSAGRAATRNPYGAAVAGGAALAAGGLGWAGQGKVREAYHHHKINERRRANRRPVAKALIPTSTMSALRPAASQTTPAATPLPAATKPIAQPKGKLQATGATKTTPVTKAQRRKVYEADRQRRLGVGIGATAVGGALLAHRGLRGAALTSRLARDGAKFTANQAGLNAPVKAKVLALRGRGIAATPRDAAQIAGGGALLATAGGQAHYARSRRNREWT